MALDERPLLAVERLRLVEDRVGDRRLADVVQLRRGHQVRELPGRQAEPLAEAPASAATSCTWVSSSGSRSRSSPSSTSRHSRLAGGSSGEQLLRVETLIGDAQRLLGALRLLSEQHLAVAGADREVLATLQQRAGEVGGELRRIARDL